jgi:hypothetical protein
MLFEKHRALDGKLSRQSLVTVKVLLRPLQLGCTVELKEHARSNSG